MLIFKALLKLFKRGKMLLKFNHSCNNKQMFNSKTLPIINSKIKCIKIKWQTRLTHFNHSVILHLQVVIPVMVMYWSKIKVKITIGILISQMSIFLNPLLVKWGLYQMEIVRVTQMEVMAAIEILIHSIWIILNHM